MAQIPVINNHTGDEGEVDESWFERWPDDFTHRDPDHVPLTAQAGRAEDTAAGLPSQKKSPSDGTEKENN